jgi:hypothetical protein
MNGTQCGSPALRRRRHCFFHERIRSEQARIRADVSTHHAFDLPLLEDANSVQMAIMKVIQMLGSGHMDHKTAGLMLYALQTASINLRHASFEADDATDVVIDRHDVHRTCIGGQQWFEEDFEGRSGPVDEDAEETDEDDADDDEVEVDDDEADEQEADEEAEATGTDRNPRGVADLCPPLATVPNSPTQSQGSPRSER